MTTRAALLAFVIVACGGDDAAEAPAAPWVAVGTGTESFAPLADGDPLELVFGPQGGWHVDLAARFGGLSPQGLVLTYRVRDELGDVGYPVKLHLAATDLSPLPDGGFERLGDRVIMSIAAPDEVVGRTLTAEAEVIQSGQVVVAAPSVVIVDEVP